MAAKDRGLFDQEPHTDAGEASPKIPAVAKGEGTLRAYYTCALTNLPDDAHMLVQHVGETVLEVCDEFGIDCFLPHRYNDPQGDEGARSKPAPSIYVEDRSRANEANLVIVYVGYPSWGGGFELEMATQTLAPVLLIGTQRHPVSGVSRMVRGAPTARIDASVDYAHPEELKRKLRDAITMLLPAIKGHRERVATIDSLGIPRRLNQLLAYDGVSIAEISTGLGVSTEYLTLLTGADSSTTVANPSIIALQQIADFLLVPLGFLLGLETDFDEYDRRRIQFVAQEKGVAPQALAARGKKGQKLPISLKTLRELADLHRGK